MTEEVLSEFVGFDVNGGVAVLELRRPEKRNAVSWDMWEAILAHLAVASGRPEIGVLVVKGSGGAFCAGADLGEVKRSDGTASASFHELVVRSLCAIAEFPVPSVASIEGACIGGGCSIALACDIRFAHSNAFFAIPAVRHGIVYDRGSIGRLVELLGSGRAAHMLFTAQRLDAAQAARIGLVDECSSELDELVTNFTDAVLRGDASTMVATRKLIRNAAQRSAGL